MPEGPNDCFNADPDPGAVYAAAWFLIGEIFRRHARSQCLRLIEMFPGGGQSHVLGIVEMPDRSALLYCSQPRQLIDFRLLAGTWVVADLDGRGEQQGRICKEALPALLSALRTAVGQSDADPLQTGIIVLASLHGSSWATANGITVRMGYADTSGDGAGVRSDLHRFLPLFDPEAHSDERHRASAAAQVWLVHCEHDGRCLGVISGQGQMSVSSAPTTIIALDAIAKHRGLGEAIRTAEVALQAEFERRSVT